MRTETMCELFSKILILFSKSLFLTCATFAKSFSRSIVLLVKYSIFIFEATAMLGGIEVLKIKGEA